MPDFKSLQCFTELVQSNSFFATADNLCLTQPSVSKIMAALEAEFGVPLLESTAAGANAASSPPKSAASFIATPSACWSSGAPSIRKSTTTAK